ncbi:DUF411 domain-containing protein [Patescibacteria group bacterium]|nr:DUF411 domain-containing protein [Patescibacteria group bacterium]
MNKILIGSLALIVIISLVILSLPNKNLNALMPTTEAKQVTVYKTPTCGCCTIYTNYLKKLGFDVRIEDLDTLDPIKEQYNIPKELESCHTTIMGDYFIEGHMPAEAIEKLLIEQPDINGIALPDMPSGTPGMPGPKNETYTIYQVSEEGSKIFLQI